MCCGALQGITTARMKNEPQRHYLSSRSSWLTPRIRILCTGARPWLHEDDGACDQPVRGALRAAGNVYFPNVESSIYLPQKEGAVSAAMRDLMKRADVEPTMAFLFTMRGKDATVAEIRQATRGAGDLFDQFSDDELLAAYQDRFGVGASDDDGDDDPIRASSPATTSGATRSSSSSARRRRTTTCAHQPRRPPAIADPHLERVRSVDVLRETRVLRGFARGRDSDLKLSEGKGPAAPSPLAAGQGLAARLRREG